MKVLILSWRDIKHPWAGGSEVYLHEIAKRMVKDGHQVTMFCAKHPGGSLGYDDIDGVKIVRAGNMITVYLWFFWYYTVMFRQKFDVIIDQNNGIPFFAPAMVSSIPVVCLTHHVHRDQWFVQMKWPLNYVGYYLEKYLVGFAYRFNKFVVVSESTKKEVMNYWKIQEKDIEIIYNAVDKNLKRTIPKSKNPTLLYVGRLKKYKQIDLIIKAMLRLLHDYPDLILQVVGDGDQADYLKDLVARLGISRSVIFYGFVSEKLKNDLLSSSWAFVTASSHEGWGISVIEANACGTLAVGSNIDGLKDAILDNKTGLLFEKNSIYDLALKLRMVLKNPALRTRMEKAALLRAKKFSWDNSTCEMENLLDRVIKQREKMSTFKPMRTKVMQRKRLPLVSVVVPTKNEAGILNILLESIKDQSYPNIELIVVDNFSSDETRKIARKYTKKVFLKGPERNQQRNLAVSKAKGKYILFLDADMVCESELIADCVYNLEKVAKAVAMILPELQIGKSIWSKARALEKSFYLGDATMESPRFFRKSSYLKSGGYDENLLYAEDMELAERMRKLGQILRSKFFVYHNEDRLGWWQIIRKKYRYGKTAKYFFAKSSRNNLAQKAEVSGWDKIKGLVANPWVYLSGGAKSTSNSQANNSTKLIRGTFIKNWRKWFEDPMNSLVLIFLRVTELSAMGFGYLISLTEKDDNYFTSNKLITRKKNG